MFGDKLLSIKTDNDDIIKALEKFGLKVTPENIARVKSFF